MPLKIKKKKNEIKSEELQKLFPFGEVRTYGRDETLFLCVFYAKANAYKDYVLGKAIYDDGQIFSGKELRKNRELKNPELRYF